MNAFYIQFAEQIFPIYGVSSMKEAQQYALCGTIIETEEKVYMNTATGSVDFASGWDDLSAVVEVSFDSDSESWVKV